MEDISTQVSFQNTEDDLKILLRILSIYLSIYLSIIEIAATISSLINLRDYPLYAWTQTNTIRIRTLAGCRVVWRSSVQFARAPFNPHLQGGLSFCTAREHRLSGATVSEYRLVTIRGVFRGPVVR